MTLAVTQLDASAAAVTVPAIRAQQLSKAIEERLILQAITLEIPRGAYVALLGANGAGKSTLLKILSLLTPPTEGQLSLFGHTVGRDSVHIRAKIGLIGHQTMLYQDLSARENLEFFGRLYAVKNFRQRAGELLARMQLADRADDPVKAFSRGMQQRVAIARALMHDPELLLADEPFAGLDAPSAASLEQVLATLHAAGKTILLVNHDISQSLHLAQHVVVLRAGRKVMDRPTRGLTSEVVLALMAGTPEGQSGCTPPTAVGGGT